MSSLTYLAGVRYSSTIGLSAWEVCSTARLLSADFVPAGILTV
jgi:hypothetical protein